MLFLLICLTLCADEKPAAKDEPKEPAAIPEKVREYFQRADVAREELIKSHETKISDLEIAIRGEANPPDKAALRRTLNQVENSFAELKRSKVHAYMPSPPEIGDIGVFTPAEVRAVIDDHRVLVYVRATYSWAVISRIDTKSLKAGKSIDSPEPWRVTSTATTDEKILRLFGGGQAFVVEPVKKGEIEKYRAQYEAEKKKVWKYFQRADAAREELVKSHETKISDLEIKIRGEANPADQAALRRTLSQVENSFAELKRSKVYAYMPSPPEIGDIGVFKSAQVTAVIDDHTVLVRIGGEFGSSAVISRIDTKSLKAGKIIDSSETWRVTSTTTTDEKIQRILDGGHAFVVERVKNGEIEKYRAQYEAEKNKPAVAAGKK